MNLMKILISLPRISARYILRNSLVLLTAAFRYVRRRIGQLLYGVEIPASIFIYTTLHCNLHCQGCISSGHISQNADSTRLSNLIDEAHSFGINSYIFLGGEPITQPSFDIILQAAKKHPCCNFNIVTSGTLLNDQTISHLFRNPNILLFVSIDGLEDLHDSRRGQGTFKCVLQGVERLSQLKIPFFVISTVTQRNYEQILSRDFIDTFKRYGSLGQIYLPYLVNGCKIDNEYELTTSQWNEMSRRIGELKKMFDSYFILDVFQSENRFAGCRAATRSLAVSVDGSVQACPALMFSTNTINESSLLDCLQSPLFQYIRQLKYENPAECLLIRNRSKIEWFLREYANQIWKTSDSVDTIVEYGFKK